MVVLKLTHYISLVVIITHRIKWTDSRRHYQYEKMLTQNSSDNRYITVNVIWKHWYYVLEMNALYLTLRQPSESVFKMLASTTWHRHRIKENSRKVCTRNHRRQSATGPFDSINWNMRHCSAWLGKRFSFWLQPIIPRNTFLWHSCLIAWRV